jgi:hypothetical protein
MKAPTSLLAGALLAGWVSSPAVAFPHAQAILHPCGAEKDLATVASSTGDWAPHEHASSCTCAHCTGADKERP